MVQFFNAKKPTKKTQTKTLTKIKVKVDAIDHHGKGLCLSHSPIIVVPEAIIGEEYVVEVHTKKPKVWFARIHDILTASEQRREPFCIHYQHCGGCSNQVSPAGFQFSQKEQALTNYVNKYASERLDDCEWENGELGVDESAQHSQYGFAYRRKARLSIDARNLNKVSIGYRAKLSNKIVNITQCPILSEQIQACIMPCLEIIKTHVIASSIGHLSVLSNDTSVQLCLHLSKNVALKQLLSLYEATLDTNVDWLVHRKEAVDGHSHNAYQRLSELASQHHNQQQQLGMSSSRKSSFTIRDYNDVTVELLPHNFIQVNRKVNQAMLKCAQRWLQPDKSTVLVDLFAGLGNFSLHFADSVKEVIAVEGVAEMVALGKINAANNKLTNIRFEHADLSNKQSIHNLNLPHDGIYIIDPSREGALVFMQILSKLHAAKILYVSCNPNSFIRDIEALSSNYQITKLKALDMFPFTEHIELMALIENVASHKISNQQANKKG